MRSKRSGHIFKIDESCWTPVDSAYPLQDEITPKCTRWSHQHTLGTTTYSLDLNHHHGQISFESSNLELLNQWRQLALVLWLFTKTGRYMRGHNSGGVRNEIVDLLIFLKEKYTDSLDSTPATSVRNSGRADEEWSVGTLKEQENNENSRFLQLKFNRDVPYPNRPVESFTQNL